MSSPERFAASRRNASRFVASRIAEVATGRTSSIPVARQKWANSSIVSSARSIGAAPSSPAASRPAPTRTASWISSVRFHQPWPPCSPHEKTTRRNEFDPRSMTARRRSLTASASLDELDAIAVGVADETDPRAALAQPVRRLLGLDAMAAQPLEGAVEVVDGQRDVVVARAELVGLDAVVVGELEPVAVAREPHEDVDRLLADRHPPPLLEAEGLVERDGAIDVADAVAGVDQLHGPNLLSQP